MTTPTPSPADLEAIALRLTPTRKGSKPPARTQMFNSAIHAAQVLEAVAAGETVDPDDAREAAHALTAAAVRLAAPKPRRTTPTPRPVTRGRRPQVDTDALEAVAAGARALVPEDLLPRTTASTTPPTSAASAAARALADRF